MSTIEARQFLGGYVNWLAVLLGAVILSFPAFFNHSAYLFPDSDSYYRNGMTIVSFLTVPKNNSNDTAGSGGEASPAPTVNEKKGQPNIDTTVFLARSPFYGTLVYLTSVPQGFWSLVAVQALAASLALLQAAKSLAAGRYLIAFAAMIVTAAVGSSLPWYVSFAMPDVWLGTAIVYWTSLIFGRRPLETISIAIAVVLTTCATLFHQSNWILIACIVVLTPIVGLIFQVADRRQYAPVIAGLLGLILGFFGNWMFGYMASRHYGEPIRQPIFVAARILADGPGREYLRKSCAQEPDKYVLCRYKNQPLDTSDSILWSSDENRGVYTIADYQTRRALSEEQWRFVIGALISDPVGVLQASIANALRQMSLFSLKEFESNYWFTWSHSDYWSHLKIFDAMPGSSKCIALPATCEPIRWIKVSDLLQRCVFLGSLLFVAAFSFFNIRSRTQSAETYRRLASIGTIFLLVLLVNAFVCGAISGPSDRYQARLSWIIPTLAALMIVVMWNRRHAGQSDRVPYASSVPDV
jgi:hypothetical protein